MTLADSVHQHRLHVMAHAQALGNVSQACRNLGVSRTLFYRWRKRFLAYGPDGVRPKPRGPCRGRPNQTSVQVERVVVAWALAQPTWGPARLSSQLRRLGPESVCIPASTVYRILRRHGLQTRWERLVVLEGHSAESAGLLTERTRRTLKTARGAHPRHVQAEVPGELVCMDTFYVGKLKGVGKIWQYTACDASCSFGIARLAVGHVTADKAARFLEEAVLPAFAKLGWPVQRVLTDGGKEYKGAFEAACQRHHLRHTRTRPRHAWTNGFVERLQGTILSELWRIAFRRRFFSKLTQLQAELDTFMNFYNLHRTHSGYRLKGRTPMEAINDFNTRRNTPCEKC